MLSKITCCESVIRRNLEKSSNIQTMRNGLDRRIISSFLSFAQGESQTLRLAVLAVLAGVLGFGVLAVGVENSSLSLSGVKGISA